MIPAALAALPMLQSGVGIVRSLFGKRGVAGEVIGTLQEAGVIDDPVKLEKATAALNALEERVIESGDNTVREVNTTFREEAKSDKWWVSGWRPFWGFLSGICFFIVSFVISIALVKTVWEKPEDIIGNLPMIIGALAALFAIPGGILGVSAWHRGKEKRLRAGEM